jgi:Flp pilus assembly protein TadB
MADKEIDRIRARSALDVIKQHPAMVLFAISPALLAAVVVGWLTHPFWGVLLFVLVALAGGWALVRKR